MSDLGAFSMWDLFRDEVESQMRSFTEALLALEREADPRIHVAAAMRAAHSIKGAARLVQLDAGVGLAHVMEDCLVAVRESGLVLNGDGIDALLASADLLSRLSEVAEASVPQWLAAHADALAQMTATLGQVRAGTWVAASVQALAPPPAAPTVGALPAAPDPVAASVADSAPPATRSAEPRTPRAEHAPALLVLDVQGQRYGLDVSAVVEVVPTVRLRPLPGTPPSVAGLCRYRGSLVPVLDLSQMLTGAPAAQRYSTRIVIVTYRGPGGSDHLLGLLAERLDHGADQSRGRLTGSGISTPEMPFLGKLTTTEDTVVQLMTVNHLVADDLRDRLFTEA